MELNPVAMHRRGPRISVRTLLAVALARLAVIVGAAWVLWLALPAAELGGCLPPW